MMRLVAALFCALLALPSASSAITFQFETLSVENGTAVFDAELRISNTENFFANADIINFEDFFFSVQTDASDNFDDLRLFYSFEGGFSDITLANGGIAISSPDSDNISISGAFDGQSTFYHTTTGFGFSGFASSFLDIWTIQFGSDNININLPTLTGRFVSEDFVSVSEPLAFAFLPLGLLLVWSCRHRRR